MTAVLVVAVPLLLAVFAAQMEKLEAVVMRHTTGSPGTEDDEEDAESEPADDAPGTEAREALGAP